MRFQGWRDYRKRFVLVRKFALLLLMLSLDLLRYRAGAVENMADY